ncbi:YcnI family protein [Paenibacillus antarcticus]|uniref:YncI copper-binding domain-containing protein n=1 Tax=Paenibacillus antarcticus TaxID=253703 RepID=A0A168NC16_9BACL|nr:YcnI family protein [Paenibacillus antarcticus]OAB45633.1 hypothetical protein PBAT_12005 [Paenibacillus antarcticus]
MFKRSKLSVMFISVATCIMMFAGVASAHVTVKPTASTPGAWETYTIKIPVERDIPTTKVTLKIPTGVDFKQYQPVPDWQTSTTKDTSGKVSSITWTATGNGIATGEFQTFNFVVQNPEADASLAWDAYQYYKDGNIVEWTGDEGSESPHSITVIAAASASEEPSNNSNEGHDETSGTTTPTVPVADDHDHSDMPDSSNTNTTTSTSGVGIATTIFSLAALAFSIAALFVALNKRKD